jgi:hypothetical protein
MHMQKQTTYQQLQPEDRITIATMRQRGCSVRAIARTLERAPSTIARELARNASVGKLPLWPVPTNPIPQFINSRCISILKLPAAP